MRRISYSNENELAKTHQKDLLNFFAMLYADARLKDKTIFVNTIEYKDDVKTPTMINVKIKFQSFKKSELNGKVLSKGSFYEWCSYRAKSFVCSNNSIKLIENPTLINV